MPHELVDLRSSMLITPKGYTVSNEGFFSSIIDAIVKFFSKLLGSGESGGSGGSGSSGGSTNTGSLVIKKISSDTDELIDRFFKLKKEAVNVVSKKQESNDENGTRGLKEIWDDQISNADKDKISEKCKKTETTNPDILRCFYSRRQGGNDRILNGDNFAKTYLVDEVLEIIRACSNAKVFNLDICHLIRYVDEQYTSIIKKMVEDINVDGAVSTEQRKRYASMIITGLLNRGSSQNLTGYIYDASYMGNDELNEGIPTSVCFGHALLFDKALEIMTACKAINKKGISLIKDTITDANIEKAFDKFAVQVTSDVNDIVSTSEFKEIDDSLRKALPDRICNELTLVFTDVYRLLVKYVISAHKLTNYFAKSVMVFCPATEISKESYAPLRRLPIRQSVSLYPTVFTTPEGYTMSNENFIKDIIDAIIKFFSKLFGGGSESNNSGGGGSGENKAISESNTLQELKGQVKNFTVSLAIKWGNSKIEEALNAFKEYSKTEGCDKKWDDLLENKLKDRSINLTTMKDKHVKIMFYRACPSGVSLPIGKNGELDIDSSCFNNIRSSLLEIRKLKIFKGDIYTVATQLKDVLITPSIDEIIKARNEFYTHTGDNINYYLLSNVLNHNSSTGVDRYMIDLIEGKGSDMNDDMPDSVYVEGGITYRTADRYIHDIANLNKEIREVINMEYKEEVTGPTFDKTKDFIKELLKEKMTDDAIYPVKRRDETIERFATAMAVKIAKSISYLVDYAFHCTEALREIANMIMKFCPGAEISEESYTDIHKPMKYLTTPDTTYKESVSLLPDYRIFTTN